MDRRDLLKLGVTGAAVGGAGTLGAVVGRTTASAPPPPPPPPVAASVPFYGTHQAGILTPQQQRLHFTAFDVTTTRAVDLVELLRRWSATAARLVGGYEAGATGATGGPPDAPGEDSGEALGLPPSQLTLTIGFGPTLFRDATGADRFGIAKQLPAALAELPAFPGDALRPEISGGDLCVQACANDPQVALHAIRTLTRMGAKVVRPRWSQQGFGHSPAGTGDPGTARNLMGFKDGTANLTPKEPVGLRTHLWAVPSDGPSWMDDGSYLVTRRIEIDLEAWDAASLSAQEAVFGRTKGSGAPLGQAAEFDPPSFDKVGAGGTPVIPLDAHVRLAHPSNNHGIKMLRRSYNYVDGLHPDGRLDAGLFFMAFQRDPHREFIPVQQALARADALNRFTTHVSSAVFACPPGLRDGQDHWGRTLFG